jgi:hypothetical protein
MSSERQHLQESFFTLLDSALLRINPTATPMTKDKMAGDLDRT